MEVTRARAAVPAWLGLNLVAMGFSLMHTLLDLGLVWKALATPAHAVQGALLPVLITVVYLWWAAMLAAALRGARAGLVGLIAFALAWVALANGGTIIYCLPPCGSIPLYADTIHLGNLLCGPLAAYLAFRALRQATPASWRASGAQALIMLGLLVAYFAVLASLLPA